MTASSVQTAANDLCIYDDLTTVWCVIDGVGHHVRQDLCHTVGIGTDERQRSLDHALERMLPPGSIGSVIRQHEIHDTQRVHRLDRETEATVIDPSD